MYNKQERRVPVLYLDIDGTVRHGKDQLGRFVNGPEDVVVFPEAVRQMKRWREAGGRIIGVSNQGGIALGLVDPVEVEKAMQRTHILCDHMFDKMGWCMHHPDAEDPEMARCWCRKPAPGIAIECALSLARAVGFSEIYPPHLALFVGDRPEDEQCAKALNVDFLPAEEWRAQAPSELALPVAQITTGPLIVLPN